MEEITFGEKLRTKRIAKEMTLRKFCRKSGYDPAYISRVERGMFTAPQNKNDLVKLLDAYGFLELTKEWEEMFNLARKSILPY